MSRGSAPRHDNARAQEEEEQERIILSLIVFDLIFFVSHVREKKKTF